MTTQTRVRAVEKSNQTRPYVTQFERLEKAAESGQPGWLLDIRRSAIARFAELGFPTLRDEEWQYTNVGPIAESTFEPALSADDAVTMDGIDPFLIGSETACRLVFINGHFAPGLSSTGGIPSGVQVVSLAEALRADSPALEPHLGRFADYDAHPFVALNTAMMQDGAFIHVQKNAIIEEPIHLLYLTSSPNRATVTYPRNLIVLESCSQATVVESYGGLIGPEYFTNAVTEIVAKENATLDHYRIGRETDGGYHIGTSQHHLGRSSTITSHTITLGGKLVRNDINAVLGGEGCECTLNGLYMVDGTRHVDNHLIVEHASAHCDSREFFKGVLDGRGKGIFSGLIIVRKGAQQTDAKQTNQSLLLSEEAQVESKPQLEIFADDVKCTHGATIGQVSAEALFYLRTRGMSEAAARSMLVYAFARESLERVRIETLRSRLNDLLFQRLPQGELLREAV